MRLRSAIILGIVLLFGTAAFAQDYPRIEIPMYYSYMRFNPENSNIVSSFSLNGGEAASRFISITFWGSPVNLMAMAAPLKRFISLQLQIALAQQVAPLWGAAICSPTT